MSITFEVNDKTSEQFAQLLDIMGRQSDEVLSELVERFINPYLDSDGNLTPRRAKVDGTDAFVFKDMTIYNAPYYVVWASGQYMQVPAGKVEFMDKEMIADE